MHKKEKKIQVRGNTITNKSLDTMDTYINGKAWKSQVCIFVCRVRGTVYNDPFFS